MSAFNIVIPARYASSRLPGKPLLPLLGRPMLEHVYQRACESGAQQIVIATDDARIESVAQAFGAQVMMTAVTHTSGTDRLAEVVTRLQWPDETIVVNVQGDEPLLPAVLIRQVAANLAQHEQAAIATLCTPIGSMHEVFNPNCVKVVSDRQGFALYFSRAPIPWDREAFTSLPGAVPKQSQLSYFRHLGLYAYRVGFLRAYRQLMPAPLERGELLEQLRALWHGYAIHVAEAAQLPGPGVDVAADVERVEALLRAQQA